MSYQWILLALLSVAVLIGITKAIFRPMLKNILRLAAVVLAFMATLILEWCGVFRNIVRSILDAVDLSALLESVPADPTIIIALVSTFITPLFFGFFFVLILLVTRMIIHFVLPSSKKKTETETVSDEIPQATEAVPAPAASEDLSATVTEKEDVAADTPVTEAVEAVEAEAGKKAPKQRKKKKTFFGGECAWKGGISALTGVVSGVLILGVLLMPMFYLMSILGTVTHTTDNSDADDSQIYQVVSVFEEHIVAPYEDCFVAKFYDTVGISDLMNYATKASGKIVLENGETVYADDVFKSILSHGVSAAMQVTSAHSACETVEEDLDALLSDPVLSPILVSYVSSLLQTMELNDPEEDDLVGGLVYNLLHHYQTADEEVIAHDLVALGHVVSTVAKEGLFTELMAGDLDFEHLLQDSESMGNVAAAISGLSAFGDTLKQAFELGIDILGETLNLPHDDAAVYEHFMEDLLQQMKKSNSTKFDINTIRYYIYTCATNGIKVSASNGVKGHSQFVAYAEHWEKVQSAFAHASEDTSYGYFTIEINGEWYLYDKSNRTIVICTSDNEAEYKDKRSPVAGLINALTLRSTTTQLTRDNLYTILEAYVATATDATSVELATRILAKENFTSKAVTVEKMLAATDFTDWTEEEKAADSRLCVKIIAELLSLMEHLEGLDNMTENLDSATDMLAEFELLGVTMDDMKQTTCIKALPSLLIEAVVKHEVFEDYMKPSIAFQINSIVENNDKTYAECMNQIAGVLKWAINALGGEVK